MRLFKFLGGVLIGVLVGASLLYLVATFASVQLSKQSAENRNVESIDPSQIDVWSLISNNDFQTMEIWSASAHQKSLDGDLAADDLREHYSIFKSTAPEVREFSESWVDEMPDSPYALTALAWNIYAAAGRMRGRLTSEFLYYDAGWGFRTNSDRAGRLLHRAYIQAPDFVPTSDLSIDLIMTNSSLGSNGLDKARIAANRLDAILPVIPNRGSLLRAMAIAQPKWGGEIEVAARLCDEYAKMITDVEGYTTEICLVEATYNFELDPELKEAARSVLQSSDLAYLDYARRKDWRPGMSRKLDKEILNYLQNEGSSDLDLARQYDSYVSIPDQQPRIAPIVKENLVREARKSLERDPYNPSLIATVANSSNAAQQKIDGIDTTELLALAKSALVSAPFDPQVWTNIAFVVNEVNVDSSTEENAFFANAITFSNHHPAYYFRYLYAKENEHLHLDFEHEQGRLSKEENAATDDAVLCPLIRLERLRDMMCSADPKYLRSHRSACDKLTDPQTPLQLRSAEAESRNACTHEITADMSEMYFLEISETGIDLPAPLKQ